MPSIMPFKKFLSFVGKKKNQSPKLDYSNGYDNLHHHPSYVSPNGYLNHHPPPPHALAQRQQLYAQHQIIPSPLPHVPVPQAVPLQPQQLQHQITHHQQQQQQQQATSQQQCLCQNCSYQPNSNFNQTSQVQVLSPQLNQLPLSQQQSPQQHHHQQQQQQQHCSPQLIQPGMQHQQIQRQQQQHNHLQPHHQQQQQLLDLQHQQQCQPHVPQTHTQHQQQQNQSLNLNPNLNQTYASQAPSIPAIGPTTTQCICANCTLVQQPQQPNQQQIQNQFINQQQLNQQHQNHQFQPHQQQHLQQQHAIVNQQQQQLSSQFLDSYQQQHQTNQPNVHQVVHTQQQHQQQAQQQQQYHSNHSHHMHQSPMNGTSQTQPLPVVSQTNQALQYQHQTDQIQPQQYLCHTIQPHQHEQQKQQQQHYHQRGQSLCLQSSQQTMYQDYPHQQVMQVPRIESHFDLKGESQDSRYANMQSIQSSQGTNRFFKETSNPKFEEHIYCNQKATLPPYEPPPSYDTLIERRRRNESLYTNGHQHPTCRSESLENKDSSYENLRSRHSTYRNMAVGRQELGHTS